MKNNASLKGITIIQVDKLEELGKFAERKYLERLNNYQKI
jgi:hypothetical protein